MQVSYFPKTIQEMTDDIQVVITDQPYMAHYCKEQKIACLIQLTNENKNATFPNGAYCIEQLEDITDDYLQKIYQRAHNLPWTILETDRLLVREITVQDVPRMFELYKDPSITAYMENLFPEVEEETVYTMDYIEKIYHFYGYGIWVVVLKDTGEIIGRAGVESKEEFDGLELGYMLGVAYQHQGYAQEVCTAILNYAKETLEEHTVYAKVHQENTASVKLCEKLGMKEKEKIDNKIIFQKVFDNTLTQ